ncbi:MAG: MotA/TolQ/ExbB proton channel family protein, partial [Betaproteobacteria bacterium]
MIEKFLELSRLSMGVIPTLVILFTIALAVVVERLWFFHRVLNQGAAMERDLKTVAYRDTEALGAVARRFGGALQTGLVNTALGSSGENAEAMERHVDEAILDLVPAMDRNL